MTAHTYRSERPPDAREHMLGAAEELLRERGEQAVTARSVSERAGVSVETFAEHFAGSQDILLALFDEISARALAQALERCHGAPTWVDGVRAALLALLRSIEDSPALGRFLLVTPLATDGPLLARRGRLLGDMAAALGDAAPGAGGGSSALAADSVVRTVAAVLHARLGEEPVSSLPELCAPLMGVVVLPYLGVEGARAELARGGP